MDSREGTSGFLESIQAKTYPNQSCSQSPYPRLSKLCQIEQPRAASYYLANVTICTWIVYSPLALFLFLSFSSFAFPFPLGSAPSSFCSPAPTEKKSKLLGMIIFCLLVEEEVEATCCSESEAESSSDCDCLDCFELKRLKSSLNLFLSNFAPPVESVLKMSMIESK